MAMAEFFQAISVSGAFDSKVRHVVLSRFMTALSKIVATKLTAAVAFITGMSTGLPANANSYLAKSGDPPVTVYVATCATSGGFIHMYTALDQNLFAKYGVSVKHVVIRTGTNINLTALAKSNFFTARAIRRSPAWRQAATQHWLPRPWWVCPT
jgi:hypothetical protein